MAEQITLHRSEVLTILRHVRDIQDAVSHGRECVFEDYLVEEQLNNISSHAYSISRYFEQEHHIGIKQRF